MRSTDLIHPMIGQMINGAAALEVRPLTDEHLIVLIGVLIETLDAARAECDRRSLERTPAAGQA